MPAPVRILRVIPRYAPAWAYGGGVRFSYDLDVALTRRGFDVTVYTSDQVDAHTRAVAAQETLERIRIQRFSNWSNTLASGAQWLAYYPVGLRGALSDTAGQFDVIHVAEARGPHVRWAFAAARHAGVPVVWAPLGGLAEGVGLRRPYRHLYDVVHHTRDTVRAAGRLIAQTDHEASVFERLGAQRAQVARIGLGVDAHRFRALPSRGAFRRRFGIRPERPLVLFMGRFHPAKGLDVLVQAMALLKRTHPAVAFVLVGWDHGALSTVTRLTRRLALEDTVIVLGPLFGDEATQAYVDADAFTVAATIYEETSLAAMEAVACGTRCVLTRQCEIPGIDVNGGGRVTDCTPHALAAGLQDVLSDPSSPAQGRAARAWMLATHTSDQVAAAYDGLFRDLLGIGADAAGGAHTLRAAFPR